MSELHPLSKLMLEKTRTCYDFPVGGYLGFGNKPVPKLAMRTANCREQELAIAQATDHVKKLAAGDKDVERDPNVTENAKTAYILSMVCRDIDNPDGPPVFPSGEFLLSNTTADQLQALLNLYNIVRNREAPAPLEITEERLESLAVMCAATSGSTVPDELLAAYPREFLVQAVVILSMKLMQEREKRSDASKDRS